ncbi:MAG: alpha-1,2-fucosyltransferase [Steroidobacteraceae bacterium]
MQVVVKQSSGLGNQLFQYAAGRCVARRYGASLRVAHQLPHVLRSYGHARAVLLQRFAISAPVRQASLFDRLMVTERQEFQGLARAARAVFKVQVIRQAPERCLFRQDLRVPRGVRTVYLKGFWQDAAIVREVETELRRELTFVEPLQGRNLEMARRIEAARNPVSIHLRRGDYGSFFGANMILPIDYYEHAIDHMLEYNRRSTFFVFVDDIPFAKDWLGGDPRFVVVDHNNDESAHEDLRLMSLCRHHIIANSTFSWWGAWLNPRRDKQVIAPARWLGFDTPMTAIACPDWTLLDADTRRRILPAAVVA